MLDRDLGQLYGVETRALNKDLAGRLDELEKKYDAQFRVVFDAIRRLMTPQEPHRLEKRL